MLGDEALIEERSFCKALVTKVEKLSVLTLALKHSADAGHPFLQHSCIHSLRCVDYFPCYLGCNI